MKASFERRISVNNATIKAKKEILEAQNELHQQYRRKEITWGEYYELAYEKSGSNKAANAEDVIADLTMWNRLLQGETLYFNGSYYTDVHPYEVVEIKTPCEIVLREMKARMADGAEPYSNDWVIESNPEGRTMVATIRETKRGISVHKKGDKHYHFGISTEPYYYYDYSF